MIDPGGSDRAAIWGVDASVCLLYYPPSNPAQTAIAKGRVEAMHRHVERGLAQRSSL